MYPFRRVQYLIDRLRDLAAQPAELQTQNILVGRMLSEFLKGKRDLSSLAEVEFRVFSQYGDDGIVQWLVHHIDFPHRTFIEFGVEDYRESNTRFLLLNNNWSGFVMDGSAANVARMARAPYFWKHDFTCQAAFVDADNINPLLAACPFDAETGILHIDIDGNDYWVWKAIRTIKPVVVILEYNSVFGAERAITVPYDRTFLRQKAHYSNLYYGASLPALDDLCREKGYAFIGCNSAGNNAYFVRRDKLGDVVREMPVKTGYVLSKFRESRDEKGQLTCLAGEDRIARLRGLPVVNTRTGQIEVL